MEILNNTHLKNCEFIPNRYQALSRLPKNGKIAEVGVLGGDLSNWLLKNLEPEELHLIDLFNCADFPEKKRFTKRQHEDFITSRFEKEIASGQVKICKGYSWDMLEKYDPLYFDIIYIDAAHDYKSVKKDLEQSLKAIKPNGYIVMNDYIMYDHLANSKYGVVQATNEFCIKHNWELRYFAFHPNLFCDVVLKKIES